MRFKEALELIDKYDLEEFYAHNSDSVTGEHFNISSYYVLPKLLSHYGIKRHSHKENITLTCLSRYGVPHSHTPESEEKYRKSILEHFNSYENYVSTMLHKMRETCREKYGVDYCTQNNEVKLKYQKTCEENWGVSYFFQTEECKEKSKTTCKKKYGKEYYSQTDEYHQRVEETHVKNYGSRERYVAEMNAAVDNTCMKRYGVSRASKLQSVKLKEYNTKRKNGSFNTSQCEIRAYQALVQHFNGDVRTQYYEERYPYRCDFYIVEYDLFIELNAHWTHGGMPYDPTDEFCQKQLLEWQEKAKTSQFYQVAINTWTVRDVEKTMVASSNNLQYKCFYQEKDLFDWLKELERK